MTLEILLKDFRKTSGGLLGLIVMMQLTYFVILVRDPLILIVSTVLLSFVFALVLLLLPQVNWPQQSGGSEGTTSRVTQILPLLIIAIAVFKISTRFDVYAGSLTGGINAAREIADRSAVSGRSLQTVINVLLTPLWINLIVYKDRIVGKVPNWTFLAIAVVPIIGLLDLVLFGARVTFAYQIAILFVSGFFTIRIMVPTGLLFIGGFIYVHTQRTSYISQFGAEYLTLTASGRTLPPLHNLSTIGLPDWWVTIAVFFQYIAHSVSELVDLVTVLPLYRLSLATLLDQLAVFGIGDRAASQVLLAQANPGNGAYQTYFGSFMIDFGVVGILIAIIGLMAVLLLTHMVRGQVQRVAILMVATNVALAPIENFFVMGAGFIYFLLSLAIATLLSIHFRISASSNT